MRFLSRRLVMPNDLNYANSLFGGRALEWIDEEAAIFAACQMGTTRIVTKKMSAIDFVSPGELGDILSIGTEVVRVGRTSLTVACEIRNQTHDSLVVRVDEIVLVALDENNSPTPHQAATAS